MFYSSPEIFVEPPTANSLGSNNNNHDENNVSDSEDHESGQIKDRKSVFIAYTKTRGKLETSRAECAKVLDKGNFVSGGSCLSISRLYIYGVIIIIVVVDITTIYRICWGCVVIIGKVCDAGSIYSIEGDGGAAFGVGGAGLGEGEIAVDVILLGNRPGNDFTHLLELLPKPPDRYAFTIYHILIELLVSTGGPALFFALWRVSELIANSGIAPETRREFSSVSDPFTSKLYIHDVSIPTAKYFKDFFILHGDDLSWSPIGTTGINMPPSRIDHAAVLIANGLVIVCGPNIDPCIGHTAVYVTVSNMIPSNKNIISLLVLELAVARDINTDNGASRPLEKPPIIYKLSSTIIVECTSLDTLKSHFLIKIDSYGDVAMYPNLDFRLNPSPEIVSIRVVKVEDEGGLGLKCGKR
nr:14059_t:CDS:10 [Entrophospora candida]